MANKGKTKSKKVLKKSFFEVEAPVTGTKIHLYGTSVEALDGRVVKIDLTKSLRGKSLELKIKIKAVDSKLKGEPRSAALVSSYIRRMMRRGTDYVEDSFETNCRDVKVLIKPFMIARKRVSRAVRKALRDSAKKFLQGYLKTRNAEEIFSDIMSNKLQKQMALKLKKVYPLALCEIRVFEILGELEKVEKKESKKEEEVEEKESKKEEEVEEKDSKKGSKTEKK